MAGLRGQKQGKPDNKAATSLQRDMDDIKNLIDRDQKEN